MKRLCGLSAATDRPSLRSVPARIDSNLSTGLCLRVSPGVWPGAKGAPGIRGEESSEESVGGSVEKQWAGEIIRSREASGGRRETIGCAGEGSACEVDSCEARSDADEEVRPAGESFRGHIQTSGSDRRVIARGSEDSYTSRGCGWYDQTCDEIRQGCARPRR